MPATKNSNDWNCIEKVYSCVCEYPGESNENIGRKLELPEEEINGALEELERSGLVEFKFVSMSPTVKKSFPVEKSILMTPKLKKELKKFFQKN